MMNMNFGDIVILRPYLTILTVACYKIYVAYLRLEMVLFFSSLKFGLKLAGKSLSFLHNS